MQRSLPKSTASISKNLARQAIITDFWHYIKVLVLGMAIFWGTYSYTTAQQIPNVLNKSVADTSIILIGLSMLLSSLCYFWNFLDSQSIYRRHLGLIGFAFGLVHIGLSQSALFGLFNPETWARGAQWPAFTGMVATVIFTVMALISNTYSIKKLGRAWRPVLRWGYLALIMVFAHVVLLKSARWITWYNGSMITPPSMSFMVTIFMVLVLVMRVVLLFSLKRRTKLKRA